jgi:hypothetical protein
MLSLNLDSVQCDRGAVLNPLGLDRQEHTTLISTTSRQALTSTRHEKFCVGRELSRLQKASIMLRSKAAPDEAIADRLAKYR